MQRLYANMHGQPLDKTLRKVKPRQLPLPPYRSKETHASKDIGFEE